jgi:hypothetical protein
MLNSPFNSAGIVQDVLFTLLQHAVACLCLNAALFNSVGFGFRGVGKIVERESNIDVFGRLDTIAISLNSD